MTVTIGSRAEVGPMISSGDIERGVRDVLHEWVPSYLAEGERQHGMEAGSIPTPRGWVFTGRDLQKLPGDQLPCIVVMAAGIPERPRKNGIPNGAYDAVWGVDIGVVCSAAWGDSARWQAQLYAVAIRTLMAERPIDVGNHQYRRDATVDWRGEGGYNDLDIADTRTLSVAVCSFDVGVRDVTWSAGGPPPHVAPPADPTEPWQPWTRVNETDVTIEKVEAIP